MFRTLFYGFCRIHGTLPRQVPVEDLFMIKTVGEIDVKMLEEGNMEPRVYFLFLNYC